MRSRAFTISLLLLILCSQAAFAMDEITITYRKAETRYGHGEGVLISSQAGEFSFKPGDALPFAYTGATPVGKAGDTVMLRGDNFVYSFLAPRPSGHGYYTISFTLPETQPEKRIEIRLEDGRRVIRSNVDFSVAREGDFLVLRATTSEDHLEIAFITELMYMLTSALLAAALFSLLLLSFIILRRRDIRANLKRYLSFAGEKAKPYLEVKEEEDRLSLYLASPVGLLKGAFKSTFGREGEKLRLSIPHWLISLLILAFLLVVFFNSITSPLEKVWPKLGALKLVFIAAAMVLSVLSALFILSARDEKALIIRLAVIGAGIVGITFAYLGAITLLLAATTAALIYFLSVLILEEEG